MTRALAIASVLLAARAASAATGRVADQDGRPIEGARACLYVNETEEYCVKTDPGGAYILPSGERVKSVRISSPGRLAKIVPAGDLQATVVLIRAAIFRARLIDAETEKPIARGEVLLTYASGARKGPFPANAAGVKVTLPAGEVMPTARADGYVDTQGLPVTLRTGEEAEAVLRLRPVHPASGE